MHILNSSKIQEANWMPNSRTSGSLGDVQVVHKTRTSELRSSWSYPLITIFAIGSICLYGCNSAHDETIATKQEVVKTEADIFKNVSISESATAVKNEIDQDELPTSENALVTKVAKTKIKLDNGVELITTKGSVANRLHQFITSPDAFANKTNPENWFVFEGLHFDAGSSKLKKEYVPSLKNTVEVLNAFPNVKVKLGGYSDNTGNEDVNTKLSEKQAKRVYDKLIALGAARSSFAHEKPYEGYGPKFPICPANDSEACKTKNRRIAIVVIDK